MPDIRQSKEFADFMEKINWKARREANLQFYIKNLPLLGPFIRIPRPPFPLDLIKAISLAKKHKAFAIRIDYSPTKTIQINLTQPLTSLLSQTSKDTRYGIRRAEKNKVVVEESKDVEVFIKMWHHNALRKGFWIPFAREIRSLYQSFGKNALLLLAYSEQNTRPISGALILFHDKTAYYFYAASAPQGRRTSAPYLVIWEAIKKAKKKNFRTFDFEGIKDSRDKNTKNWGGFTHFKKGFGGKEIELPLSVSYYPNPLINMVAEIARSLRLS
ncbi:MAG: peptidoglycan bridge formation glycyltransferase FemA/FemB family protein [bacterium]|nr:peptidoglycan bridge formation glycyltransferase FemA/FemB family protein [bacterium]